MKQFKEQETQAAMAFEDKLRDQLKELELLTSGEKPEDGKDWIWISWCMQKELLKQNIESVREQIRTQTFDW